MSTVKFFYFTDNNNMQEERWTKQITKKIIQEWFCITNAIRFRFLIYNERSRSIVETFFVNFTHTIPYIIEWGWKQDRDRERGKRGEEKSKVCNCRLSLTPYVRRACDDEPPYVYIRLILKYEPTKKRNRKNILRHLLK